MPIPAPTAPRPTPTPKAIALPRSATFPSACASKKSTWSPFLVFRFDGAADVDGGEQGEDEGLDRDDDDHLEEVDERSDADRKRDEPPGREDENEAEHHEDQHVAGEHVREEADRERDEPHELRDDLERHDQREEALRRAGRDPTLEVAGCAVVPDPFHVRREERDQGER